MKFTPLFAVLLVATSGAAMAQSSVPTASEAPSPLQTAVQQTAMGFAQCVMAGMQSVQASVAAPAAAAQVLGGCSTQRGQLVQAAEALIASLPEAERAPATAELQTQLGQAETRIAAEIERRRTAAAATPAQ